MAGKEQGAKVGLRGAKSTLAFGLVRVGVGMAPLMETEKRVSAKLLDPVSMTPVKRQWVDGTGDEVADPVKGYPFAGGLVVLEDGEVPKATSTENIDLIANVQARDIPAEYVEKTYLLWPDQGQEDGYALVTAYLRDHDRAFVGSTVSSGTTKAFAVRYSDVTGTLVAQLLSYEANVRWASVEQVAGFMKDVPEPAAEMIGMAETVFDQLPEAFDWSSVTDEYGEALAEAIATKAAGGTVVIAQAAAPAPAVDLMAALKASVEGNASAEKPKATKKAKVKV
jgi:DNA end-binding protein Ku